MLRVALLALVLGVMAAAGYTAVANSIGVANACSPPHC
jgi:hypothetical protein